MSSFAPGTETRCRSVLGIAASILLVACAHPAPRSTYALLPLEQRPLLAVSASAERLVPADSATITLGVEYVASAAQEAVREVSSRAAAISRDVQPLPGRARLAVDELAVNPIIDRDAAPNSDAAARVLGQAARLELTIENVPAADAEAVVTRALASGASEAEVIYTRVACAEVLGQLRIEAVALAHARARNLVSLAHTRLGSLYRLKEDHAECPVEPEKPLWVKLEPASDASKNPPILQLPTNVGLARLPMLRATVGALLVYELVQDGQAPAGEGPGEVHLGLLRSGDVETQDVSARIQLRVGVAHEDPTTASQQSSATMESLLARLRAAGLQDAELIKGGTQVGTRTTPLGRGRAAFKVRDYVAQSRVEIATTRIAQLGPWIALAAQSGATGLSGPTYEVEAEASRREAALQQALTRAMQEVSALAQAGGQELRSVTQIRINDGWLSESDPLQTFIQEFGHFTGGQSGYGGGHGSFSNSTPELDKGFPVVEIRPPTLHVTANAAVGFALHSAAR